MHFSCRRCSTINDIETLVYTPLARELREAFPGIFVTGEYVRSPSNFPHVSIVESDNYTSISRQDSSLTEKFTTVMFEVNVYSNKTAGKKTEAKSIINYINEKMYAMNFTRLSMTPVPNLEDASIYRITARYRAEIENGEKIYRI